MKDFKEWTSLSEKHNKSLFWAHIHQHNLIWLGQAHSSLFLDARRWAEKADGSEPQRTSKHTLTQPHALALLPCGLMAAQDGRCLPLSVSTPVLTFQKSPHGSRVAALRSAHPASTQNAPFVSYLPGSSTRAIWFDVSRPPSLPPSPRPLHSLNNISSMHMTDGGEDFIFFFFFWLAGGRSTGCVLWCVSQSDRRQQVDPFWHH